MQIKEHVIRLCMLARLHKKGAAALTRTIDYSTSSLISVLAGRCNMNVTVEKRLGEALGFYADGFYHSGQVVSWLARNVDDVVQLLEHGFEIEILARFVSDREKSGTKTKRSVLYQLALLRVSFGETERFVVLRMTQQGIDRLLAVPRMNDRVLLDDGRIVQAHYRYLDMSAWMDIDAMPWNATQEKTHYSSEEKRRMLLAWLTEHVKSQSIEVSAPALSFETKLNNMLIFSYDLRIEKDGSLVGVTNLGQIRRVCVCVQRAIQSKIELPPPEQLAEHLIVCVEHMDGLVEIAFEGPTKQALHRVSSIRDKSTGPIPTSAYDIRLSNMMVLYEDRLKGRRTQHV
jgi:hypothetical protein